MPFGKTRIYLFNYSDTKHTPIAMWPQGRPLLWALIEIGIQQRPQVEIVHDPSLKILEDSLFPVPIHQVPDASCCPLSLKESDQVKNRVLLSYMGCCCSVQHFIRFLVGDKLFPPLQLHYQRWDVQAYLSLFPRNFQINDTHLFRQFWSLWINTPCHRHCSEPLPFRSNSWNLQSKPVVHSKNKSSIED